jgi:hypothetical protein
LRPFEGDRRGSCCTPCTGDTTRRPHRYLTPLQTNIPLQSSSGARLAVGTRWFMPHNNASDSKFILVLLVPAFGQDLQKSFTDCDTQSQNIQDGDQTAPLFERTHLFYSHADSGTVVAGLRSEAVKQPSQEAAANLVGDLPLLTRQRRYRGLDQHRHFNSEKRSIHSHRQLVIIPAT